MGIYHLSTDNRLALCRLHLFYFVEPGLTEGTIRRWYFDNEDETVVYRCLLKTVLPKIFNNGIANKDFLVEFEKAITNAMLEYSTEDEAKETASQVCNPLVAIVIESYYDGTYKRESCEISEGFVDTTNDAFISYENYRVETTKDNFTETLEKIRISTSDEQMEIYADGTLDILETSVDPDILRKAWKAFSQKQLMPEKKPTGITVRKWVDVMSGSLKSIPWHYAYCRAALMAYAIIAIIIIGVKAYPYLQDMAVSTDKAPQREAAASEGLHSDSEAVLFEIAPNGEISFIGDKFDMFGFKVCETEDECMRIDWEKPDGMIPASHRLYVKKSCWIAVRAYSEEGDDEKTQFSEVNFCDILTYLFRQQDLSTLRKMTDKKSVYSKDREFPDGCYLDDYYRSAMFQEDFGEKGKYKVTGYEFAPRQDKGLFDLRNKDYPKLKEISIEK